MSRHRSWDYVVECDECGTNEQIDGGEVSPSIKLLKSDLRGMGWRLGNRDLCPECKKDRNHE